MRISNDYSRQNHQESRFDRLAEREDRKADRQAARDARRAEKQQTRQNERAERQEARRNERTERREDRQSERAERRAERQINRGHRGGPVPFPPEVTTLALGEEDGGGGGFPINPDGPTPIGGNPIPVEPDGGIGDGAGPIPFPEITTLAVGEEDGGAGPIPLPPIGGPEPVPGRVQPPTATGSYRLGQNDLGANFLNFDGNRSASIIGPNGTNLSFGSVRTGEDGSIFGEAGSGSINGIAINGGAAFKLSISPNDAGYLLQVKANGGTFEASAGPNGIVPPSTGPTVPLEPTLRSRGGGLLFLYSLGENSLGATNVTLNTDGTGTITGPDLDLTLSGGGFNDSGDWVATAGSGTINGASVMLKQNPDGNVFVASGEGGLASQVSAWIEGGLELEAAIVAVAQP